MNLITLDLEGVLIPEIWQAVAQKTGISALNRTTRDEPNYDTLMRYRLDILKTHGIRYSTIAQVIGTMSPLPGAREFLDSLRMDYPLVILSDTFAQFARPLLPALGYPTIFCHELIVENEVITGYRLRQNNQKKQAVEHFQALNYRVMAAGDSYNDTAMLQAAEAGFFFHAPPAIQQEFPQFPAFTEYPALRLAFDQSARAASERESSVVRK
jgi:phosphoserine/homoserine phosphotransferase